jgi:hypothetical protein
MKVNRAVAFRLFAFVCLAPALACGAQSSAAAPGIPVRYIEGTLHGFLAVHAPDGHVIAAGELSQVVHGSTVTAHLTFHFRDGSLDEETTVFSERGTFRLISDHHIQQGPAFPTPMDLLIDVPSGRVTSKVAGKDGKPGPATYTVKLPPDLANGLVGTVAKNIKPDTPDTKVSMLVMAPKPLVVKLDITPRGQDSFDMIGLPRKALHYNIQIQLGGLTGVVATMIGKHPPDIQLWILGGEGPTFLREDGQWFQDGPIWSTQFSSPDWPDASHPADAK